MTRMTKTEIRGYLDEVQDPAVEALLTEVLARLDAHAAAIRKQAGKPVSRKPASRETAQSAQPELTGTPGVFVPNPHCYMCGGLKQAGRNALTCYDCGVNRNLAIKQGTLQPFTSCGNCGNEKGGTQLLCSPCRQSRANQ